MVKIQVKQLLHPSAMILRAIKVVLVLLLLEKFTVEKKGWPCEFMAWNKGLMNAYERGIVFHGGDYVSTAFLLKHGRIGRSLGCFVTEPRYNARIIRLCRFGAKLFVSGHEPIKF